MAYCVTENCIKCKYTDCVAVCPVDCFYEGDNMLVINPEECIDCDACVAECPSEAIKADIDLAPHEEKWLEINANFSQQWPNICERKEPPADADKWNGVGDKIQYINVS